ncbi:hypothetical protein GPUN_1154 [Glaciecola punicea ACAM 611]|uniref:Uncharacterized protein n=1 Tax=Glaciecola punicea ACAM 611 TaxID=1121923 RepID=H5TAF6_9ALTE|nr:hypothetical protein GPUN_1154 [Glaciecola punicea ACAM 611]
MLVLQSSVKLLLIAQNNKIYAQAQHFKALKHLEYFNFVV